MAAIAIRLTDARAPLVGLSTRLVFETYWRPSEGLSLFGARVLTGAVGAEGSQAMLSFLLGPA
eukprot:5498954-Lingulodinium_polyedra.AAC.1